MQYILIVATHPRPCKVYVSAPHAVIYAWTNVVSHFGISFSFDNHYNDGTARYHVLYIFVADPMHSDTTSNIKKYEIFMYILFVSEATLRI